jgi:hypothetical protein
MSRASLTRGITRLLIVASVIWAVFCLIEVPREAAESWFVIAIGARENGDIERANNTDRESKFIVQLKEHWSSPYMWLLTFAPPVLAYGVFRLLLAICYWIYSGFQTPK